MGRAKELLKDELLKLDPVERAEVAEDALESLDHSDHGALSPAWEAEIQRRLRSAEEHPEDLIPGEDVFREIEAELRARRGQG
jgi:putative addiction module component (TIGR02574 family)